MHKHPKFTDSDRFSAPYVQSGATDIAKTFRRIQAQMKAEAEKKQNVTPLKRAAK